MEKKKYAFSQKTTTCYFDADFDLLTQLVDPASAVVITDENIARAHRKKLQPWQTIVLPAGEHFKNQSSVDRIIARLIELKADRTSTLIGVGGGVITDITGYTASIYMRGVAFGFVPTSLLGMVDASIGGKNGIDVGVYKNFVGVFRQPDFLLYDRSFLATLPHNEWVNGFAEIIKHACIKDARLFRELSDHDITHYKRNPTDLDRLIRKNVIIKCNVVQADEFEKGERKLLNFGHTWGHAIETTLNIPHGHAVAVGMVMACRISSQLTGFADTAKVIALLKKYRLPTHAQVNRQEIFNILLMDKKKDRSSMNYVLLEKIGKAQVQPIALTALERLIHES